MPNKVPGVDQDNKRVTFDYIKSNCFRVIHVDGMFGGIGPRGLIQISVFNERWPIPQQVVHKLSAEGGPAEEILEDRVSRDAIVREVEGQLLMSLETAKSFRRWLDDKITATEKEAMKKTATKPRRKNR